MLLRPPAPKNIAFNREGGKDFTGPSNLEPGRRPLLLLVLLSWMMSDADLRGETTTGIQSGKILRQRQMCLKIHRFLNHKACVTHIFSTESKLRVTKLYNNVGLINQSERENKVR